MYMYWQWVERPLFEEFLEREVNLNPMLIRNFKNGEIETKIKIFKRVHFSIVTPGPFVSLTGNPLFQLTAPPLIFEPQKHSAAALDLEVG